MFLRTATTKSTNACYDKISRLKQELETADAVVIGAGAGLSTPYLVIKSAKYFARAGERLFCPHDQCGSPVSEGRI